MKAVRPTWFAEPTIIHASWCPSQVFVSPRPKCHTAHFWGRSWGLQGQRGPVSQSWSHQTERASASLSKGSLDVRTYHSSFPTVETWHLFQKMPNVFSLHICCHISDLSLVRALWKKERSKQANLSVSGLLGYLGWLNCLSLSKLNNGHINTHWTELLWRLNIAPVP